jgi:hypothetical protein
MRRAEIIVIASIVGISPPTAASLTQEEAIAAATKICTKQATSAYVKWIALAQEADWLVMAILTNEDGKMSGLSIVIPAEGPYPTVDLRLFGSRQTPSQTDPVIQPNPPKSGYAAACRA